MVNGVSKVTDILFHVLFLGRFGVWYKEVRECAMDVGADFLAGFCCAENSNNRYLGQFIALSRSQGGWAPKRWIKRGWKALIVINAIEANAKDFSHGRESCVISS